MLSRTRVGWEGWLLGRKGGCCNCLLILAVALKWVLMLTLSLTLRARLWEKTQPLEDRGGGVGRRARAWGGGIGRRPRAEGRGVGRCAGGGGWGEFGRWSECSGICEPSRCGGFFAAAVGVHGWFEDREGAHASVVAGDRRDVSAGCLGRVENIREGKLNEMTRGGAHT